VILKWLLRGVDKRAAARCKMPRELTRPELLNELSRLRYLIDMKPSEVSLVDVGRLAEVNDCLNRLRAEGIGLGRCGHPEEEEA
jgi:hypothetical protein